MVSDNELRRRPRIRIWGIIVHPPCAVNSYLLTICRTIWQQVISKLLTTYIRDAS